MSKFCGTCGAPLTEGAGFCGSCGTVVQRAATPAPQAVAVPQSPASPSYQPVNPSPQPPVQPAPRSSIQPEPQLGSRSAPSSAASSGIAPAPIPTSSSSLWVKVAIAAVIIIFVGGAAVVGGVWYVAHKVSEKAHAYSRSVLGDTSASSTETSSTNDSDKTPAITGDPCRLLSKEDVSSAIGVTILETKSSDDGCSYLAKGSITDMTAKHSAAMIGAKGADKKTQAMIEMFAGAIGNSMPKEKNSETESAQGNAVVFGFMVDNTAAREQMKLNSRVLGSLGPSDGAIDGIGDEAFAKADGMLFVRKGDKLIRFMYTSCPCTTTQIKPLAKELVDSL